MNNRKQIDTQKAAAIKRDSIAILAGTRSHGCCFKIYSEGSIYSAVAMCYLLECVAYEYQQQTISGCCIVGCAERQNYFLAFQRYVSFRQDVKMQ